MLFSRKKKDAYLVWKERFPYFEPEEVLDKDGQKLFWSKGEMLVSELALNKLCEFRRVLGEPIIVNSGFRSSRYNASIGGAMNSFHCLGLAFDVKSPKIDLGILYREAKLFGWRGIGRYDTFLHIDWRPILSGSIREWDFRKNK